MRRVLVVGSANVDLLWQGPRLPAPGETVTDGTFVEVLGGKGANQAAAAATLGAEVAFVGCVGADPRGEMIRDDLLSRGIDCTAMRRVEAPTGVALITVDAEGENAIAVAPGANRSLPPDAATQVQPGDIVLCSCEIPLDTVAAVVDAAHACGALVIVNPAPARRAFAASILTPNEHEAAALGGVRALAAIATTVAVTRGALGADLHRADHDPLHIPAFTVDVVDTTGAGDAFNGALAWALANERAIEEGVRLACAAGALATRAVGTRASLPTSDEIYALTIA